MSDNIRSRRRLQENSAANYSTVVNFETDPDQKNKGLAYSSFSTVFNASASQLWNSAQEALASTYDTSSYPPSAAYSSLTGDDYSTAAADEKENLQVLDKLGICGSPYDLINFTMPSRDRTSEFRMTAKSFEMKAAANGIRPQQKSEVLQESVQFNQLAKRIGRDLSQTCAKMEKLAEFAKKKSLYEERSQIEHLSSIVKEDITGLNKQIAALQEFSRRRAGNVKNQNNGHSQLVVVGLQSKLASVSKDFQSVIEISTENMKAEKTRRNKFSSGAHVPMGLPSSSASGLGGGASAGGGGGGPSQNVRSRLLQDDQEHGSGSIALDMGSLENYRMQQTMQQQDTSLQYAQDRSNTMATIEGSISELGQIFSQLATLVSEQGEMITRIDSNVEDTALNIDMAHTELVRYLQNISKNRWLMLQIFGVLMMRFSSGAVIAGTGLASAVTFANAFVLHKEFYPSIVYISKSSASMAVLYVQALVLVYLAFEVIRSIFFGELRAAEAEHLSERTWHAIIETCLAFTVFRDEFSPTFVMLFIGLLFIKRFHWLADDRVDMMERSPIITIKFHLRMMAILGCLGFVDSYLVSHAYFTTLSKGASSQIIFGFEYAILMTLIVHITIKYILHMHDLRTEQSWDNKAVYLLYAELFINFIRCILYGIFAIVMLRVHTLPFFWVRPFYQAIRALHKAFSDVVLSRRAIQAMNTQFPLVSAEELTTIDTTCIICREEMTADSSPKRLPCSHVFHAHCLRSWFQRQQTCPTCRTEILGRNGLPIIGADAAPTGSTAASSTRSNLPIFFAPAPPNRVDFLAQFPPPIPPPPMGFGLPPAPFSPPVQPRLEELTNEQLLEMEGNRREAILARLRALDNVMELLDAAHIHMTQLANVIPPASAIPTTNATVVEPTPEPTTPITNTNVESEPVIRTPSSLFGSPATPITPNNTQTDAQSESENVPTTSIGSRTPEAEELRQRRLARFDRQNSPPQ
ncbi:unnamed protein product [Caenorhabditis angaria]|uniref:RING-type E3 ubiquitin transferase n=1 Tax=Caenorhabditis angaria TaxID=860376 RepID=A0A9P1IV91_9PELO|nr:unnamed protein product [Caenorhabditis angaria]